MSVLQNDNGTLRRVDLSALSQVVAVDTENILGGGAGAQTDGQTLVDQLAADDVQLKSDLLDRVDWESNAILGAHNLCPYPYKSGASLVSRDVTFTANSDGTINANGTNDNTNNSVYILQGAWASTTLYLPAGSYKVSTGTSNSDIAIVCCYNSTVLGEIVGEGEIDAPNGISYITCEVKKGKTVNNVKIYPMIRLASDTDTTYAPYAMTNRELMTSVQGLSNRIGGVFLNSTDNMNDARPTGIYPFTNAPVNSPEGLNYGVLLHIQNEGTNEQQYVLKGSAGVIYLRSLASTSPRTWGSWSKLQGTVI